MSKKKIFVGTEYEDAFQSIYTLIQGGCFEGMPYTAVDDVIGDGTYEYELKKKTSRKRAEEVKYTFEQDGATWFKPLRGEKVPDDDSIWNTFRSNIIIEYHKRFSVVEYKNHAPTKEERKRAVTAAKGALERFCKAFYPDFETEVETTQIGGDLYDDIYGISMKIEVSGGTGASVPVLGKVYFNREGKQMTPLSKTVAESIEDSINSVIPDDDDDTVPSRDDSVLDYALNSMQSLIENQSLNFADYIYFGNKRDRDAIFSLLAKLSHDAVELECQRVDILYITHIQTNAFQFITHAQGKPAFEVRIGVNESVSIRCVNCNEGSLIVDRNQITYTDEAGNARSAMLNFAVDGLGLDAETLAQIKETGAQRDHFISVACKGIHGKDTCLMHKCKSQIFEISGAKEKRFFCKDCPHPEVVYTTSTGEKLYTPSLAFAFDKMELVSKEEGDGVASCSCCGRSFSASALQSGKCPICHKAGRQAGADAKLRYKKYKNFLPLFVRLTRGEKACFEDDEIILFVVGNKRYIFNKLHAKDTGYVSKPKRVF